ncbi:MAG: NADH-quinone oxidoreductase subunit J [Dehalococcoidia bacterium]|nr:NADH-quinone oxidoreductase subunit J [Dehalococcoidia bacterium]
MTAEAIAFWVLAALAAASALGVVLTRNIVRMAASLVICFLAIAGLYATLAADFLAAAQVLIYVGAISVLIIMAVMLTREMERGNRPGRFTWPALAAAVLFTGTLVWASLNTDWPLTDAPAPEATVSGLGDLLFKGDSLVLVVEMSALLIIAAIIGAISIARDK